jgi:hypothetical protein
MLAAERGVDFCVVLEDLIIKGLKDEDNSIAA